LRVGTKDLIGVCSPTLLVEEADEIGLYSVFSSAEALQKYAVSEAHVDVVTNHVKPNVDGREYLSG
jgi:hypothetical protein